VFFPVPNPPVFIGVNPPSQKIDESKTKFRKNYKRPKDGYSEATRDLGDRNIKKGKRK
jgi:hypothetical protein